MNKQTRRYREYLKYKNRIKRFVANGSFAFLKTDDAPKRTYISGHWVRVDRPTVQDIMKDGGWVYYKHTSTPCSCYMCSGYYKYRRHEETIKIRKEIQEGLEDFYNTEG